MIGRLNPEEAYAVMLKLRELIGSDDDTAAIVVLRLQEDLYRPGAEGAAVEVLHLVHNRACTHLVAESLIGAMGYFCDKLRAEELDGLTATGSEFGTN